MYMTDSQRSEKKLRAVFVDSNNDGDEYYEVGKNDVTSIEWGWTNGDNAALQTIVVHKGNRMHSEHCFSNVLGVYYAEEPAQ